MNILKEFHHRLAGGTTFILLCGLVMLTSLGMTVEDHPFHVSKCDVVYSEKEKSLQIAYHIFIDDLEVGLKNLSSDKLYLATPKEKPSAERLIVSYMKSKFVVSVNKKQLAIDFVGREYAPDKVAIWCYFEVNQVSTITELSIQNTVLMEVFDDQKNIVHVVGPEGKKGHFLHQKGREVESIKF